MREGELGRGDGGKGGGWSGEWVKVGWLVRWCVGVEGGMGVGGDEW